MNCPYCHSLLAPSEHPKGTTYVCQCGFSTPAVYMAIDAEDFVVRFIDEYSDCPRCEEYKEDCRSSEILAGGLQEEVETLKEKILCIERSICDDCGDRISLLLD